MMNLPNHGRVQSFPPERNNDPTSHLDPLLLGFWNSISEQTGQGQRKNDIHKHLESESTRSGGVPMNVCFDLNHKGTSVVFFLCIT